MGRNRSRNRRRGTDSENGNSFQKSQKRPSSSPEVILMDSDVEHDKKVSFETENVTIDSFSTYYHLVMEYLSERHWLATETVAPLLSLQHGHCNCPFLALEDANESCSNRPFIDNIYDDIILMHLAAAFYVSKGRFYTAYNLQWSIISLFSKEILQKEKESNYFLPLLPVFCSDLRILAKKAEEDDHELDREPYMEEVANVFMSLYRICVADNRVDLQMSKKVAIVSLTVELFRLYFETNKMALLKPLIRAIDSLNPIFSTLVSLSDLVAYNYFLGKKAIFDGDMKTANRALEHSFKHCPDRFKFSKRSILTYWLPVKMYLGCVPAPHVLEEYELAEFQPVVDGVNHGDIDEFRKGLAKHSHFFLKNGIFLILEKLISLTYLALLKRLFDILNDGSFKMKLEPFFHCLKRAGEDISDLDEAGNIVAGLIADGKLKGYISQSHQTIVFSKKDAFPILEQ